MLAEKGQLTLVTLGLENKVVLTKVAYCLFTITYKATLVTLFLNQYLTKVYLSY
jgi:hypothetical protein